mgnify:CR=1 FL=1
MHRIIAFAIFSTRRQEEIVKRTRGLVETMQAGADTLMGLPESAFG